MGTVSYPCKYSINEDLGVDPSNSKNRLIRVTASERGTPINYSYGNSFKPIDNSIKDYSDNIYSKGVMATDFKVKFSEVDSQGVKYTGTGDELYLLFKGIAELNPSDMSYSMIGSMNPEPTITWAENEIAYLDVLGDGIHLSYKHTGSTVKQSVEVPTTYLGSIATDNYVAIVTEVTSNDFITVTEQNEVIIGGYRLKQNVAFFKDEPYEQVKMNVWTKDNLLFIGVPKSYFEGKDGILVLDPTNIAASGTESGRTWASGGRDTAADNADNQFLLGETTAQPFRNHMAWDLSGQSSGTVSAATIDRTNGSTSGTAPKEYIIEATFSTTGGVQTADYTAFTGWASSGAYTGGIVKWVDAVTVFATTKTFNSTGEAAIETASGSGWLTMNSMYELDVTDNLLAGSHFNGFSAPLISYTVSTGYANDVSGVASANISTVNGVATANIDTVNGV